MAFLRVAKSGTLSLDDRTKSLESSGRHVYRFGFGESPFLPLERVRAALISATQRKDYMPVAGLPEMREKIADFHQEVDGYPIKVHQVLVASGSKPRL